MRHNRIIRQKTRRNFHKELTCNVLGDADQLNHITHCLCLFNIELLQVIDPFNSEIINTNLGTKGKLAQNDNVVGSVFSSDIVSWISLDKM